MKHRLVRRIAKIQFDCSVCHTPIFIGHFYYKSKDNKFKTHQRECLALSHNLFKRKRYKIKKPKSKLSIKKEQDAKDLLEEHQMIIGHLGFNNEKYVNYGDEADCLV